jgi:hypothetical protein
MAEPPGGFTPYDLIYSGLVHDEFAALLARAKRRGKHRPLAEAAKIIDYRLRVYPQFGEPIRDSAYGSAKEWTAIVPPVFVRYVLFEERRVVNVVYPITPLSRSGY